MTEQGYVVPLSRLRQLNKHATSAIGGPVIDPRLFEDASPEAPVYGVTSWDLLKHDEGGKLPDATLVAWAIQMRKGPSAGRRVVVAFGVEPATLAGLEHAPIEAEVATDIRQLGTRWSKACMRLPSAPKGPRPKRRSG